jgi:hypothetical protein
MDRILIGSRRDRKPADSADRLNIGVTGLSRYAGTTFIASSLALYFAEEEKKTVTYTECARPSEMISLLYDAAAFDRRFAGRKFYDFYNLISSGKIVRGISNLELGVDWRLVMPGDEDLNSDGKARLIRNAGAEVNIFDVEAGEEWLEVLMDMDLVIAVADPVPSKLIRSSGRWQRLMELKDGGCDVRWIVNMMNEGVSMRQIRGYLKTGDIIAVPDFGRNLAFADEFACRFHWQNEVVREKLMPVFTELSH